MYRYRPRISRREKLVCSSSESERAQINMRGRKCLDALAESSFPLYNRRCVDDSRRSGNKTTSSYDIEVIWLREAFVLFRFMYPGQGYRFQLLGIDISSSKVHRAELRRSLLERILSFLSVAQSVWVSIFFKSLLTK